MNPVDCAGGRALSQTGVKVGEGGCRGLGFVQPESGKAAAIAKMTHRLRFIGELRVGVEPRAFDNRSVLVVNELTSPRRLLDVGPSNTTLTFVERPTHPSYRQSPR